MTMRSKPRTPLVLARSVWCRCVAGAALSLFAVSRQARAADQVIEDPELAAVPHEAQVAPPPANGPRDTTWRVTLHTRWGVDTDWARPSQDIVEGTTVAVVEAEQRRSDTLLLSAGLRARHGFAVHQSGAARYELDVAPVSLYADVTPGAGYHVRAGYQIITMGRFDLFSATNFLATYDLRSGPVTMSEASPIATPALRFDFDKIRGFTLQAFYVPFFVPHLVTGYGSNYALFSLLDRFGGSQTDANRQVLERIFTRSGLTTASTSALQALAPAPDFREPQGALRATVYGSAGEISATIGTALEPLPSLQFSPEFQSFLNSFNNPNAPALTPDQVTALENRPIQVEHNRYGIASMDAALDAGPVQLGAEAAYMLNRTLIETRPNPAAAVVQRVNMAQFALRAELVEAAGWAASIETFLAVALKNPTDPSLNWVGMDGKYLYGVAGGAHWAPEKSRLRFELGGAALAVATFVVMPRIEWEALNAFFVELGGVFVQGKTPSAGLYAPRLSFGGVYSDVDQVFVGLRWAP
jgi:hypothetical protein